MTKPTGDTTDLVRNLQAGGDQARNELIRHTQQRLHCRTHQMLRSHPGVRRWEETDDVLQNSMLRLDRALRNVVVESSRHFWNLAVLQIRRELCDLADHYLGSEGLGGNHHTDAGGRAADDPGQPLHNHPDLDGQPSSLAEFSEFHKQVQQLPDDEREVFSLIFYAEKSQPDVAAMLEISLRTVKRRWQSARYLLAKSLKDWHPTRLSED